MGAQYRSPVAARSLFRAASAQNLSLRAGQSVSERVARTRSLPIPSCRNGLREHGGAFAAAGQFHLMRALTREPLPRPHQISRKRNRQKKRLPRQQPRRPPPQKNRQLLPTNLTEAQKEHACL